METNLETFKRIRQSAHAFCWVDRNHTAYLVPTSTTTVSIYLFNDATELVSECHLDLNDDSSTYDTIKQFLDQAQLKDFSDKAPLDGESLERIIHSLTQWSIFVADPHKTIEGGIHSIDDIMADRNS